MNRIAALMGLSFLYACTAPAADAEPDFDTCLITSMAAVTLLEEGIDETEDFLTRARLTQDAYETARDSLAEERASIDDLLSLRADMLRDDALDASEQATRNSVLIRNYAGGADSLIANAKANELSGAVLAERAKTCARNLMD